MEFDQNLKYRRMRYCEQRPYESRWPPHRHSRFTTFFIRSFPIGRFFNEWNFSLVVVVVVPSWASFSPIMITYSDNKNDRKEDRNRKVLLVTRDTFDEQLIKFIGFSSFFGFFFSHFLLSECWSVTIHQHFVYYHVYGVEHVSLYQLLL